MEMMESKIEEKAKNIALIVEKELGGIKVETEKGTYIPLKSDGLKLHHAGYFIATEPIRFGQLFYAFSLFKTKDKNGKEIEEKKIIPFILDVKYKDGAIDSSDIIPLHELDFIDLGETIAQIEKKTISVYSISTGLPLEVVEKIKNRQFSGNSLDELRAVYQKLKEKLKTHVEQKEVILDIGLCWSIATYWNEVFGVMPILELIGVSGSGKTRFATALCFIAKKGLGIADPTDSNITRIIDGFKPTLLIDDWDEVMRSQKRIAHSILKHVYKQGVLVPRMTQLGKRFFVDMFSPYAPVIITTCEPITEPQLQRRIIEIQCEKSTKQFQVITELNSYFYAYFKDERNKLYELMFVLLPKIFETFKTLEINLPPPYSEIWGPILTVAKLVGDDVFNRIYEYAKNFVIEKEEEVYKEERLILEAIARLFDKQMQVSIDGSKKIERLEFRVSEVWDIMKEIVVKERNELSEKEFETLFKKQKLGLILNRMGVKKGARKGSKGERTRFIDRSELEELCRKFGYNLTDNSDMSDKLGGIPYPPETHENAGKSGEKPGSEDVSACQKVVRVVRLVSGSDGSQNNQNEHNLSLANSNNKFFLRLSDPHRGICSYCGEEKYLEWIDNEGYCLCDGCRWEDE